MVRLITRFGYMLAEYEGDFYYLKLIKFVLFGRFFTPYFIYGFRSK